jgi:hypothetical protein
MVDLRRISSVGRGRGFDPHIRCNIDAFAPIVGPLNFYFRWNEVSTWAQQQALGVSSMAGLSKMAVLIQWITDPI